MRHLVLTMAGLMLHAGMTQSADDPVAADETILKAARLGTDGPALLDYFRGRTLNDVDAAKARALVQQLGDDTFEARERASAHLVALGAQVEPFLHEALKNKDIEIVRRAEECLKLLKGAASSEVDAAAIRLLAARRPAGTLEVLLAYVPFVSNDTVAAELRTALSKLARKDGQLEKSLVAALADKAPLRRAASAEALIRAGAVELRPELRKLLQDPNAVVRLQVALALAKARERDAIPVLIELLNQLPPSQGWAAEDLLFRLADEKPPLTHGLTTVAGRRTSRDAWVSWWEREGPRVDLAKLTTPAPELGYVMMVLLDAGKVIEVDAKQGNKLRWEVAGLELPLDVELLPGRRLLLAEHDAQRVTERNYKGEVLWEKKLLDGPLVAQRLANGNIFICTRMQMLEVNRDGKEVWVYSRPDGEGFRKAVKLPNGDYACVTSAQRYVRLSPSGKELASFAAEVHTNGGRLDVQANGNVLIPQMQFNKVSEYDRDGKLIWEAETEGPIAAIRLGNGNTLITTLEQKRAIEIDRDKKVKWEYAGESKVTRAFRR